ncbi:hypothetical protein KDH_26880 [Dictyobacter sp. S3.2.2.5]|uniref:Transposase for insertion sequence element IS21-like C-terminal domain-containing protein n=1 Tax=Dictyobacter halimunensis TaxID=3026934 RepID=A0ABQ6FNP4_9CHLR|nr:hypothetical protein KDH_26880 [Dictyobacter sp. S3.2.2.5]
MERLVEERLLPLPADFAWERFATEERKVSWDGYVSYDDVLYGIPGPLRLAGRSVLVRERKGVLTMWSDGKRIFEIEKRPRSQESVPHPDQWKSVPSVSAQRRTPAPLGHLQPAPDVVTRPLQEYDQYGRVESVQEVLARNTASTSSCTCPTWRLPCLNCSKRRAHNSGRMKRCCNGR